MPTDTFADGTLSITPVLRPRGSGWEEIPMDKRFTLGYPARAFIHRRQSLSVISAVEVADDGAVDKGPEYHISISKQLVTGGRRCDSTVPRFSVEEYRKQVARSTKP